MPKKGYVWSLESIQKRANSNRGRKRTEESKQKMHDAQVLYNSSEEVRKKKSATAIKQWSDPIAIEAARQRAIKQMSDPKAREHLRNINLGKKASEETKRKMSISSTQSQKDVGLRQRQSDAHKGSKSHLWKGGITPLVLDVRHSHRMRIWRNKVFERDNYTCTKCFKTRTYLNAHHIFPFSKLMQKYGIKSIEQAENCEELWDISNGVTLCRECHKKTY